MRMEEGASLSRYSSLVMGNTSCRPKLVHMSEEDVQFLQENTEMDAEDIKVNIINLQYLYSTFSGLV